MLVSGFASRRRGVGAFAALDLYGGMVEAEALLQARLDVSHDPPRVLTLADAGMQRHHAAALRDRPDMHMVHALDACDIGDQVGADRARVELARRPFEQDMAGIDDHLPSAPHDDDGDQEREQRVDRRPAGQEDHRAGGERRHRAEQVAEHMNEGAAHIEIVAVGATQQEERGDIHQ